MIFIYSFDQNIINAKNGITEMPCEGLIWFCYDAKFMEWIASDNRRE